MKLIAETAWHHDGDFTFFKKLITALVKETQADYIKLHITLDVDEYIYKDHPGYEWVNNSVFNENQWVEIIDIILLNNKKTMLLFNDTKAIDFGMQFKPELVEIHSVCLNDIKLLNHLKKKLDAETKIVLGVGGSDVYELENAIQLLDSSNIVFMHGFQNYPTQYEDINLGKIRRLMMMYPQYQHGYADHTAWDHKHNILITIMGAALGMDFIEKHVTISTGQGRTDWQAAIDIDSFNELAEQLKILEKTNGSGLLKLNKGESSYSTFGVMKKAAILSKNVLKGDALSVENFEFKRTGQSSDLSQLQVINSIGKIFTNDFPIGYCINTKDII